MNQGLRRGEVYLVDLAAHGGPLRKKRPVVIVQNDVGNRVSPETIVVAVRDSRGGRIFPILVEVGPGIGGLAKRSIVDCGHIHAVPKAALARRLGELPRDVLMQVDQALRVSLDLET